MGAIYGKKRLTGPKNLCFGIFQNPLKILKFFWTVGFLSGKMKGEKGSGGKKPLGLRWESLLKRTVDRALFDVPPFVFRCFGRSRPK